MEPLPIYECDKSGACCRQLIIEISEEDFLHEPRLKDEARPLKAPFGRKEYYDEDGKLSLPLVEGWEDGSILACGETFACGMLAEDNTCSIYPTRPHACFVFRAGSEQCQDARHYSNLPPLEPIGHKVYDSRESVQERFRIHQREHRSSSGITRPPIRPGGNRFRWSERG